MKATAALTAAAAAATVSLSPALASTASGIEHVELLATGGSAVTDTWDYSTLLHEVDNDAVRSLLFHPSGSLARVAGTDGVVHSVLLFPEVNNELVHTLSQHKVYFEVAPPPLSGWNMIVASVRAASPVLAAFFPIWVYFGYRRFYRVFKPEDNAEDGN